MASKMPVSPATFEAIQNVDVVQLSGLTDNELRPILPCLVRMSLCAPLDTSDKWTVQRKAILKCLSGIEVVNNLVGLLSIDFQALEQDSRREQQLRSKIGGNHTESVLISQLQQSVALEFERSDAARKLRLLLSELLFVMSQIAEPRAEFYQKSSELFENEVYLEEVSDVLCIAQAELPSLLPVTDVAEALLHVENGTWLLCRLVANVPDTFLEVCSHLVANGEKQDEESLGGQQRGHALTTLCQVNPNQAMTVRALCVKYCRLPGLAVALTLNHGKKANQSHVYRMQDSGISDVVGFVSGLLLGSDAEVRNWFAQFVRGGQKKKHDPDKSTLHALRKELLDELNSVVPPDSSKNISESQVVQGCAFIRLYCALKGIAALRFSDEEIKALLRLVTSSPPATPSGVRFVSLGLCMLLACPYLIGNPEQERTAIEWIRGLLKEVSHFERCSGVDASFGEMLLLIAIHFHSNQTHAIADLVCSTLGMKSAVKANALARMKTIFTQEIFTEQVVTSHAVKVPVTKNLNAGITGFLPIHCIYQLLRSRAFSKHKVPIKDWIFKQICHCTTPIHSLLPPLIEVYIQSIILPSAKTDRTNEPMKESEIMSVFKDSLLVKYDNKGAGRPEQARAEPMELGGSGNKETDQSGFPAQLLLLYYILLYQDTLLANMKTIVANQRSVHQYSAALLGQLPMKYLLRQAQKKQQLYAGLFSPLLRLLVSHYPHLCLVEDWLDEEMAQAKPTAAVVTAPGTTCTVPALQEAFESLNSSSGLCLLFLEQLLTLPPSNLLTFSDVVVNNLSRLLQPDIPPRLQEMVKRVWLRMNTIVPRKLRVMTVNALRIKRESTVRLAPYTDDDITLDPLIVLRCDDRVFRCPPILEIILRILEAFLQASRSYLSTHIQANPIMDKAGQVTSTVEREELKMALIAAQESAAVQILLESCLPKPEEKGADGLLCSLREVQCLICSHLHQMFIADPALAKLVHFQGYPSELLPLTVAGIPSMHICLDFIPELFSQPHLDKQIFAIELVSYLSLQYALPKSMSIAKLAINIMSTMLGVLTSDTRPDFFLPTLPALVRICKAFPPLCNDAVSLLLQLGRVCTSQIANAGNVLATDGRTSPVENQLPRDGKIIQKAKPDIEFEGLPQYRELSNMVQKTFADIVSSATLIRAQSSALT